jgi:hypothetical protein
MLQTAPDRPFDGTPNRSSKEEEKEDNKPKMIIEEL